LFEELKVFRLGGKKPSFQDVFEVPVFLDEVRRAVGADTASSGKFVGGVAPQGNEVGYLLRFDAVALAHFCGTDAEHLAATLREEDGGAIRGELERVTIAAGDEDRAAVALLGRGRGGEKIVSLKAGAFGVGETEDATSSGKMSSCSSSASSKWRSL
jgi:hypothetical protein